MLSFPFTEASHAIAVHWPWFWPAVGGVFGAIFGSFLNCARWRVPRGLSLRHPPSMCPSCKTRLGVPDLVPVFSYLALRGKCRHCKAVIGSSSLWIEIACVLLFTSSVAALQCYLLAS